MKKLILFFSLICLFFLGCDNKPRQKFEAFNAQAFAFDIGDGYEVNASTRVKGFKQEENEKENFSSYLEYYVDIVTPAGDTMKGVYTNKFQRDDQEAVLDVPLEAQFELDTSFTAGEYMVLFKIIDKKADETAVSSANFKIEKED